MLLQNKQVAIIGGGPGGLTLAKLLQLNDVEVKVYERDLNREVRVQGATLDLHFESGLKVIEAAGLLDAFKRAYRPGADLGRVVDKHGTIIYDEHNLPYDKTFGDEEFRPEIDRGDLRDILLNSLRQETVVWNSHFSDMSQIDGKWKIEFKNGTSATADIVIGADGGNSKIRSFLTTVKPFYAGTIILQGNIEDSELKAPAMHKLLKGGKIYTHTTDKFIHVSAKGDGSIDFYISILADENWLKTSGIDFNDRAQLINWFKNEFPQWNAVWHELFKNVSLPLLLRPQFCMPLNDRWATQSTITLLGDAAHLMPPSGEGVNLAMLDALDLCENLTGKNYSTIHSAIAAYEKTMLERGIHEAKDSMETVDWMHTEEAMEKLVRLFTE